MVLDWYYVTLMRFRWAITLFCFVLFWYFVRLSSEPRFSCSCCACQLRFSYIFSAHLLLSEQKVSLSEIKQKPIYLPWGTKCSIRAFGGHILLIHTAVACSPLLRLLPCQSVSSHPLLSLQPVTIKSESHEQL